MHRPRLSANEAAALVQLACVAASSSPGSALSAIVDALRDLIGADCAVACGVEGARRAGIVRLLRASVDCPGDGEDLIARVAALEPRTFRDGPVLLGGSAGPLAVLATKRSAGERIVLAASRRPRSRAFTRRDGVVLSIVAPVLAQVVASLDAFSLSSLTPRELQVVQHAARGLGDREIARTLRIGFATVRTHLQRAFAKLGVSSRTELAWIALSAEATPLRRPEGPPGGRTPARGR